MTKIKFTLLFLFFGIAFSFSQSNLSKYKYIIVAKQYEFQKSENSHEINRLTSFLFKKNGFTTLFSDEQFPEDLAKNPNLALKAIVKKNPNFLKTKMQVLLNDYQNKTVFTSKEGISREKDYKQAYHQAIRDAFTSFNKLNYSYKKANAETKLIIKQENSIEKINTNTIPKNTNITRYKQGLKIYELHRNNQGFDLFEKNENNKNVLALKLLKSKKIPNVYYAFMNSEKEITIKNIAYFDKENNLILDGLNQQNSVIEVSSIIFTRLK
jgi:hypothetical protein